MEEINLKNYAYLGDAVWELFVREKTIFQTQNAEKLHKITTDKVKAKAQHDLLMQIQEKLSDDELEIMREAGICRFYCAQIQSGRVSNGNCIRSSHWLVVPKRQRQIKEMEEILLKFL